MAKLRLGVNVDHVATVRNARGGDNPDPVRAAKLAQQAGADGITAHLREDRRHISDDDIARLSAALTIPLNLEMAAKLRAPVIEIHTGAWCDAVVDGHKAKAESEWQRIVKGAALARSAGLEVHAGHGLDYATAETIAGLPEIVELNIGYYMIGEALFVGLGETVRAMRAAMDRGRRNLASKP